MGRCWCLGIRCAKASAAVRLAHIYCAYGLITAITSGRGDPGQKILVSCLKLPGPSVAKSEPIIQAWQDNTCSLISDCCPGRYIISRLTTARWHVNNGPLSSLWGGWDARVTLMTGPWMRMRHDGHYTWQRCDYTFSDMRNTYQWLAARLGLYSLSGKTSYRKISWSLEAARFEFRLFQSLWNLTGTSAAALPRCLSDFGGIRSL